MYYNIHFTIFVDMNTLRLRARQVPLPKCGVVLSLSPLLPTSTLLVSDIPQNTQEITLQFHFERFSGFDSITSVKFLSNNKALVTFVNSTRKSVHNIFN